MALQNRGIMLEQWMVSSLRDIFQSIKEVLDVPNNL
jgi:hypothetical protein